MDIDLAEKLLALAIDKSTTEEERRTAGMKICCLLHESDFLPTVRTLVEHSRAITQWLKDNRIVLNRHGAKIPPL